MHATEYGPTCHRDRHADQVREEDRSEGLKRETQTVAEAQDKGPPTIERSG